MTRRGFLTAGAPALLRGANRPNIVLIMTDQQTRDAMSCAGNRWLKTPAMDRIAAMGTRYTRAYCAYPVCSPSRSSVFTGVLPHAAGVMENGKPIRQGLPTLGEVFAKAGYQTAYGGKWHLPKSFDGMTGFTRIAGGSALGKNMDSPLADACVQWVQGKPSAPFFLVASFMNPHDICDWIRQHKGTREHPELASYPAAPRNMAIDPGEPEAIQYHREQGYDLMSQAVGIASGWRTEEFRHYLYDYYRMVEDVDRQVGRLLDALEQSGLMHDTVIAFCSDHGEGLGGHKWAQKASFYEESARVPLMLAGPGVPRRRLNPALSSLEDLMPTLCDLAGLATPESCTGVSLLKGGRAMVSSQLRYGGADREGRMIRTHRHKYVLFNSGRNPEQLFDLASDPGETRNLAGIGAMRKVLLDHRRMLKDLAKRTGDLAFA
ncbi:MAG: sulfatase-like hydrolase/transferase [Bryobacterales bacterium]|nr:sulfatase-like hydrolase/transferase [Bryobacterales bacterium]